MDDFRITSRKLAIVATIGPAAPGNDLGGFGIYTELCPVLNAAAGQLRLVRRNGDVQEVSPVDQRTLVRVHDCSWEKDEDANRLRDCISALRLRLRLHAEYLRENGESIYLAPRQPRARKTPSAPTVVLAGIGLAMAVLWVRSALAKA